MVKYLTIAFMSTALAASIFSSCDPQTGTPVDYAQACDAKNEKKYVQVTGFLDAKGSVFCSNTGGGPVRCGFKLMGTQNSDSGFTADIAQDGFSNAVEKFESNYQKKDIKIHDYNGSVFTLPAKVKLVGQMNVQKNPSNSQSDVCFLTVTRIDKL